MDDNQLYERASPASTTCSCGGGRRFVDPDTQLSYFTCDQVTTDVESPGNNDANWCDLPTTSSTSSRRSSSTTIGVSRSCTRWSSCSTRTARTSCSSPSRPAGLPHRPLRGMAPSARPRWAGAVLQQRRPRTPTSDDRRWGATTGHVTGSLIVADRRCRHRGRRWGFAGCRGHAAAPTIASRRVRPRFVLGKVAERLATLAFVLVFNFFLFRVVNDDPTASMFRGRNMSADQIQQRREQFDLTGSQLDQFVAYVRQTLQGNLGDSFLSNRGRSPPRSAKRSGRPWHWSARRPCSRW
jgi:hypothetical protein